jgi:hypothetical protein
MMEAARTSETLVNFYQTTRLYSPEDSHLQNHGGCGVRVVGFRNVQFQPEKLKGTDHFGGLGVCGRMSKRILKKQSMRVWFGFNWLTIDFIGWFF